MWRVYLSRAANCYVFGGSPDEMLSARVHRECWPIEPVLDFLFFWHVKHCARCHRYETDQSATHAAQEEA